MTRLLTLGLVVAFSCLYLEWGGGNSAFIFQAEYQIIRTSPNLLEVLIHPVVLSALLGQLLLIYCAVRATPSQKLNRVAILIISPIAVLVLLGSVLTSNLRGILSTVPFAVIAIALWRSYPASSRR